ncbi:MAG: imidazole glycerol phosphate synthase subunit HisF [Heliobacteriaceae bacterium]|nr:imidazole glycerol phosphate synthase subunit HisF [Heliobacteriaceae bacterium]MDD4586883.1 imidazole glycerol phosphate synthase subunit HisF [Heliobacteriaceae bacterium]
MTYRRIIPCLDVKDGRLVKGINFENLQDVGDPALVGEAYCRAGADELVFLDITATLENRNTRLAAVKRTVAGLTVPLTVGGGIGSLKDIDALMSAGVTKVSINTAAVHRPDFVPEAVKEFGGAGIVIAIDTRASARIPSGFEVMVAGGQTPTGLDAVEWAKRVEAMGVGCLLPTSMDADGTQAGYDLAMTRAIADAVNIPVIASGGAGTLEHLYQAITEGHADAVLVASIAHFGKYSIREMKEYLAGKGIPVKL